MKARSQTSSAHPLTYRPSDLAAILLLIAATLAPASLFAALGHELSELPQPLPAPDFTLQDMDGEPYQLSAMRGKVVMLNFWATWCPPCREEIPSMESVYQDLKNQGFVVLAVNQWETPDQVFAYMGQLDVFPSFPILFDQDSSVADAYGIRGLPSTLLIDKQGRVVYRAVGGRNFNHPEVRALIERLLAEPAPG